MKRTKQPKENIVWDGIVKGLGIRTRGVSTSWILQTRIRAQQVKRVVGDGEMPRPEARDKARRIIDELKATVEGKPETLVTVAEFGQRYIADKSPTWAAATIGIHQRDLTTTLRLGSVQNAYPTWPVLT